MYKVLSAMGQDFWIIYIGQSIVVKCLWIICMTDALDRKDFWSMVSSISPDNIPT